MKKQSLPALLILLLMSTIVTSQVVDLKGVILAIEDEKVYLDLNESNVSVGDRLKVVKGGGYFIHPVTGEQIPREPEIVAFIQITEAKSNYSVGTVSPRGAIISLATGMEAFLLEGEKRETREFRKSIAVQPMNVSSARGGYLGFYIADLLTEELFNLDKFKVIDRQTLGLQMDEIALTRQGIIDEKEAIALGKMRGVDYFITGTVYEPDVIETATGVPIKGILQAAEAISGQRMGSQFVSDVRISQLRAIVNITLRVVDVETGEILFIASEMQQAVGRSQIDLEQGALGGMQLQGGATSFLNTITGQATRAALVNLASYINSHFEGKIKDRNFRGNIIEIGKVGTRAERNELIRNTNASINQEDISEIILGDYHVFTVDKGKKDGYRKGFTYPAYELLYDVSQISGENVQIGMNKIGRFKITYLEEKASKGILTTSTKNISYKLIASENIRIIPRKEKKFSIDIFSNFFLPEIIDFPEYYSKRQMRSLSLSALYEINRYFRIGLYAHAFNGKRKDEYEYNNRLQSNTHYFYMSNGAYGGLIGLKLPLSNYSILFLTSGFLYNGWNAGTLVMGGFNHYLTDWFSLSTSFKIEPYDLPRNRYKPGLGIGAGFHIL